MPSSDTDAGRLRRRVGFASRSTRITAIATTVLSLVFYVFIIFGSIPTRDAAGNSRAMRLLDLVRLMLDHYPAEAPVFLNKDVFLILLILTVPLTAYLLVAIWRLRS